MGSNTKIYTSYNKLDEAHSFTDSAPADPVSGCLDVFLRDVINNRCVLVSVALPPFK